MNLQNIPSHNKDIRKMFKARTDESLVTSDDDCTFVVDRWCEVETPNGWKFADSISVGDSLQINDGGSIVTITVSKVETLIDKNLIKYYYEYEGTL